LEQFVKVFVIFDYKINLPVNCPDSKALPAIEWQSIISDHLFLFVEELISHWINMLSKYPKPWGEPTIYKGSDIWYVAWRRRLMSWESDLPFQIVFISVFFNYYGILFIYCQLIILWGSHGHTRLQLLDILFTMLLHSKIFIALRFQVGDD